MRGEKREMEGCYAVIFVSQLHEEAAGYAELAREMLQLAQQQPGFLGVDSVRDAAGAGITVSYWESEEAIAAWREHAAHLEAQRLGRERFYKHFTLHISRVERSRRL